MEVGLQQELYDEYSEIMGEWAQKHAEWIVDVDPELTLWRDGWVHGIDGYMRKLYLTCASTTLTPLQVLQIGQRVLVRLGQAWRSEAAKVERDRDRIEERRRHTEAQLFEKSLNRKSQIEFLQTENWVRKRDELDLYQGSQISFSVPGAMLGGGKPRRVDIRDSSSEEEDMNVPGPSWRQDDLASFYLRRAESDSDEEEEEQRGPGAQGVGGPL
jgi:hypothetical protein